MISLACSLPCIRRRGQSRLALRQERLEFLRQVRQFGGGGKIPDPATHVSTVCGGKHVEEPFNVAQVLGAMRDRLHNEQIFHLRQSHAHAAQIMHCGPGHRVGFERQSAEDDIDVDARFGVTEEQDASAVRKLEGILDAGEDTVGVRGPERLGPLAAERGPSRERLTDAPPALADFGDAGFPLGLVLKEIRRGHERPDLAEFELHGCAAKFLDFKHACLLRAREILSNRLAVRPPERDSCPFCLLRPTFGD